MMLKDPLVKKKTKKCFGCLKSLIPTHSNTEIQPFLTAKLGKHKQMCTHCLSGLILAREEIVFSLF